MVDSTSPDRGIKWECIQKEGYKIYQSGRHIKGNFIRVFAPDSPYEDEQGKVKVVVYLHGFALCMPRFYQQHLERLVKKRRYYVLFPDFQKSKYPNKIEDETKVKGTEEKNYFGFYSSLVRDLIVKGDSFAIDDFFSEEQKESESVPGIEGKLSQPSRFAYLRVALALLLLIAIIKLIYWFKGTYGKHLINLIDTVFLSLVQKPRKWMENAIALTEQAWGKLCEENHELEQKEIDVYVFGHSLGGLLALSWPAYITPAQQKFSAKQIITADPAPSTEMGIPPIAVWILKLFQSPFTAAPIKISDSGSKLNVPVGIMHGAADKIVKPQSWVKRSFWQRKPNFDYIASQHKKIYFSLSNEETQPPLVAFHNQAVTETKYFSDALFENFGGVKHGANAYNYQYIWPGLHLVVQEEARADELLDQFPLETIQVTGNLPDKPPNFKPIAIAILVVLALFGFGYWFLHYGTVGLQATKIGL
ncbi:MAG: hypothetical protein F6K14_18245 [Symploca sp. SIO2C1]|nr:hypothetical protein [Symploca sp. SIO2C1]